MGFGNAWYNSQKEHWLGWLAEYDSPGAYGRQTGKPRDAQYIYNHIQCAPMLFWLAEAVEIPADTLEQAFSDIVAAPANNASQCSAFRKLIPWRMIDARLLERPQENILCSALVFLGVRKGP